jgi:hypothetical protein
MLGYAAIILALGFSTFLGYGVLRGTVGKRPGVLSSAEWVGYSFSLGLGITAAAMVLLTTLRIRFTLQAILWTAVVPIGFLVYGRLGRPGGGSDEVGPSSSHEFVSPRLLPVALLLAVLGVAVFTVFFGSFLEPISEVDTLAAWAFHAKVFYYEGTALPSYLTCGASGEQMSHWPPFYPLLQTWNHIAMGTYDDYKIKLLPVVIYLMLLVTVWGILGRHLSRAYALSLLVVLATLPALVVPFPGGSVASAYADLPVALLMVAALGMMLRWVEAKHVRWLVLAGVLSAFAIWTKREGNAFALAATLGVWLVWALGGRKSRARILGPASFTAICSAGFGLIVLYNSRFAGPALPEGLGTSSTPVADIAANLLLGMKYTLIESLNPSRWGFMWILLAAFMVLRWKKLALPEIGLPLFIMALQTAGALVFMAASGVSMERHASLNLRRVLIQLAPMATVALAYLSTVSDRRLSTDS